MLRCLYAFQDLPEQVTTIDSMFSICFLFCLSGIFFCLLDFCLFVLIIHFLFVLCLRETNKKHIVDYIGRRGGSVRILEKRNNKIKLYCIISK